MIGIVQCITVAHAVAIRSSIASSTTHQSLPETSSTALREFQRSITLKLESLDTRVPDKVASRIASSIGSSSFMKYNQQHKMLYSFNVMDSNTNYDTWDFLESVPGSWNETSSPYNSARRGSFLLSRFAIGSLAMLDSTGPRLMFEGDAPYLGIKMDVNWQKVAGGVAGLLGVQLFVV
jgi:hypothetical protein